MVVHNMRDRERICVVDFAAPLTHVTERPGFLSRVFQRNTATVENKRRQESWWKRPANCDLISAVFSFICLFLLFLYRYVPDFEGSDVIVRVSQETLLFTRDDTVLESMRLLHATWNEHCNGKYKLLLQKPTWPAERQELEKGRVMHSSIYAFDLPIFWLAVLVFLFSIFFQLWRYFCSDITSKSCACLKSKNVLYKPESGPDFSRWLEYFFTSPLQVVIVSSSFGFATVDALLGQYGMQAALVLLGYDIEQQIKKIYRRKHKGSSKQAKRFHHALQPLIADLRIFVYLGFSWFLHFAIWGFPYPGHGIGGKFAQLQQQLDECIDADIPDAVSAIYWLQFFLFTVFGVVCTVQVIRALLYGAQKQVAGAQGSSDTTNSLQPLVQSEVTDKDYVDACEDEWRNVAWWYSFLSITAKTCLEAGLAAYVAMYQEWEKIDEAQWQMFSNSTCAQGLHDGTCYALTN